MYLCFHFPPLMSVLFYKKIFKIRSPLLLRQLYVIDDKSVIISTYYTDFYNTLFTSEKKIPCASGSIT